jgi:hypothetical protein
MEIIDTKISRHEDPNLVKVEFVGVEDAVMISMRGAGVVQTYRRRGGRPSSPSDVRGSC